LFDRTDQPRVVTQEAESLVIGMCVFRSNVITDSGGR
jgi:hypothetical protein